MAQTSTPEWAQPEVEDTVHPKRRNVPISMTEEEIERVDAVASKTRQSRSQLLKRIVHSALYSADTETMLGIRK